jgi:hypothetical protein
MLLKPKHQIIFFLSWLATTISLNIPVAWANQLNFRIHNHSGANIVRLYVSDSRHRNWEEDVMGRDILRPGEDTNINFNGPVNRCLFDIKAIFSDGNSAEKHNVNLCTISDFYFD